MPLFRGGKALKLSACCWVRSMWRPPPHHLCGSASPILSRASTITHLINREYFNHILGRFPRYNSLASSSAAAAAPAQLIASSSSSDDEQIKKPTAASLSSSSEVRFELVRHHVVEILNGLRRELNLALDDAGAQGRAAATCAAIVRVLCGSGVDMKSIKPLFSEIISSDHKDPDGGFDVVPMSYVVIDAFDAVIRAYAHLKMPVRAAQTFFQLRDRGFVPCINTCNFLMKFLVGCDDMKSVEDVYRQIRASKVSPNLCTFRFLMDALCSQGKSIEALNLLDEMRRDGIMPDSSIYSELVCLMCDHGTPESGYQILKCASKLGISLTAMSYNLIISGLCEMEELCDAEIVLEDMVRQGVPPDVDTYGSLIEGYCSSDVDTYGSLIEGYCSSPNILRVLSLLDQMDVRGIKTDYEIQSSILHCFSELGLNAQVLELFEKFKNSGQLIVDNDLYNIAIDAQCKLGKMEAAVEMFQEMKRCGIVPENIHYNTLINGYCCQGEMDNAWKTFSCMTDVGLKPDVVTYNILARGFAKSGFEDETFGLLYHMLDHGVEPDSDTYANVVEGLVEDCNDHA